MRHDSLQLTCEEGGRSGSTADRVVCQEVLRLRDGHNKGQTGVEVMSITRSTLYQGDQIGILAYEWRFLVQRAPLSSVVIAIIVTCRSLAVDTNNDAEESSASHEDGVVKELTYSQASDSQTGSQRHMRDGWQEDLSIAEVLEVVLRRLWKKISRTTVGEYVVKVSFLCIGNASSVFLNVRHQHGA